jgi:fatty acid desaturase
MSHETEPNPSGATLTMAPAPEALAQPVGSDRILANGRPAPGYREQLRRIPSYRNALSVASCYVQTIAIIVITVRVNHWAVWIVAFVLMGRAHAQFAALMHEAAHRLLFRNKAANDWVGRWLLGYPSFTPTDAYRRGHMAHHREEFGPNEPDIPLYRDYPITRASFRRKLVRDATGRTGWKLFKGLLGAVRSEHDATRMHARRIVGVQLGLITLGFVLGHPWLWLLLWFLPHLTVWRVINRLRAIAEHGGMRADPDRRFTTHTVRQHRAARSILVPYWIGFHLAHHADSGVPMRHLPEYHRELVRAGYVTDTIEYRSYPALWRALSSRPG